MTTYSGGSSQGGTGGYGGGFKGTGGYSGGIKAPPQVLELLAADGTVEARVEVPQYDSDWYAIAKRCYPVVHGAVQMPAANIEFTETAPPFNACTYSAAEEYIAARFGRKLHSTDREWLAWHPYAKDSGVPEAYTPSAIQQLVEPYGLAVARIRVRAGKLVLGDELQMWALALGVNPFGLVDRRTDNAVAAEQLHMSRADAEQWFRFEYHEEPLPCSIVGERGWTGSGSVQVGNAGGHARYLAPRAYANDWTLSLQLAPSEQVTYNQPLQLPAYKRRAGVRTVRLSTAKKPDGRPMVTRVGARYVDPDEPVPTVVVTQADGSIKTSFKPTGVAQYDAFSTSTGPAANKASGITPEAVKNQLLGSSRTAATSRRQCNDCKQWKPDHEFFSGVICRTCWDTVWQDYMCPNCKEPFTSGPILHDVYPVGTDGSEAGATMACRDCTQVWDMRLTDALWEEHPNLAAAIQDTDEWNDWYLDGKGEDQATSQQDLRLVPDAPPSGAIDDPFLQDPEGWLNDQTAWANEGGWRE